MSDFCFKYPALPALDGYHYLDEIKLFYVYFGTIPSARRVRDLNLEKVSEWIEDELGYEKKYCSSVTRFEPELSGFAGEVKYYILRNNIVIKLDEGSMTFMFDPGEEGSINSIIERVAVFTKEKVESEIHMVISSPIGLDTEELTLQKPELVLDKHYNDDLKSIHDKVVKTLRERNKSGLILFHGIPGTGKSTYIKSLICGLTKKVILMTPELAGAMGTPEISKFLIRNAESVLVIEDAERLVVSRDTAMNSSISTILNLTDGILGDALGIQIIATFNTDLHNIDKALLRKGRMLALYEFKPLEIGKSERLLKELGYDNARVNAPMTLAEIFNYDEKEYELIPSRNSIGFK